VARRTFRPGDYPDCILIAVDAHINDMQDISAAFALLPKPLATAGKEHSCAGFQALRKRLCVHMPHH
jgi:hypothetical protein